MPLAEQFLTRSALSLRKPVRHLGDSAQATLLQYHFPGNVRELSNLIERAVLFCPGDTLEFVHFPSDMHRGASQQAVEDQLARSSVDSVDPSRIQLVFRLGDSLSELEDRIINEVLQRSDGNKTLAAKHLGITRWKLDRRRKADS